MTDAAPAAFQRLGVLPDADARAIRSAYARALKKIDPDADAAGFQQLRSDYEAALQFVERLADHASVRPDVADVPLPALEPTPEQLADAVADAFRVVLAALGTRHAGDSDAAYQAALRHALADERLFGIEARFGFELRVAIILVSGWQPGHEALLVAATAVFDWARGVPLASLGRAGAILDRALDERAIFDNQALADKQAQKRVLRLLRTGATPDAAHLRQDLPFFARMQARFPHWLVIVAPQSSIAYWNSHLRDPEPVLEPMESTGWAGKLLLHLVLVCAIALCYSLFNMGKPPHAPIPPRIPGEPLGYVPPPPHDLPVPQARIDDIFARVDYTPSRAAGHKARAVTYQVLLDVDGVAFGVNLIAGSGDPDLDAAVKAAILSSARFSAETQKNFRVTYHYPPPRRHG